ncbi:ketoacyl-ACP synthase III family protein [Actinocrispum wychmicini]|uniref:3-oxoacyl-[acyl-carrier-protein] synthase-3 n=1 Tax=Actinocrispum wychmicini TaxID=1213861 RepID=A0A4R2JRD6_9PSEU|nr:ketoacyl-ACP synthase III family protein [Actinocrispum wychmicini]TCO62064.1 3-oxoacyl-[acyl-carrier-protein] synthase-3 [Actinocrispum wychmicini]
MRWDSLYVAGVGTWLPEPLPVAAAVIEGKVDEARVEELAYKSVLVADELSPPEMAVRAADVAIGRAGIPRDEYSVVLHNTSWYQGHPMWPSGSYVGRHSVGAHVPCFEIQQRCNGALGSIELAGAHLASGISTGSAALLTTGDRFVAPAIDRWHCHPQSAVADGGTAAVLSAVGGFARVVATSTAVDNTLEQVNRGLRPFSELPPDPAEPFEYTSRYREYVAGPGGGDAAEQLKKVLITACETVLSDAGIGIDDVAVLVIPAVGAGRLSRVLGVPVERTSWDFAASTGHLASGGDQIAGFANLLETGSVSPGDHVMLFGGGGGYTCTAAVLQINEVPDW